MMYISLIYIYIVYLYIVIITHITELLTITHPWSTLPIPRMLEASTTLTLDVGGGPALTKRVHSALHVSMVVYDDFY